MSILKNFTKAASWNEWEVGTHGIIIDFVDPYTGHPKSATFLPEVALHQKWSVRETLNHLIAKAGCNVRVTDDLLATVELTRYESSLCTIPFEVRNGRDTHLNLLEIRESLSVSDSVPLSLFRHHLA